MYYLDRKTLEIVRISKANIIKNFAEKVMTAQGESDKYFYEDGKLWLWTNSGRTLSIIKKNITKKVANIALLKFAIVNAEKQQIFFLYDTRENCKVFEVLEYINCLDISNREDFKTKLKLIQLMRK